MCRMILLANIKYMHTTLELLSTNVHNLATLRAYFIKSVFIFSNLMYVNNTLWIHEYWYSSQLKNSIIFKSFIWCHCFNFLSYSRSYSTFLMCIVKHSYQSLLCFAAVPRSKKSLPTFEASYTTFGVDYSKPLPQKQPSKHSSAPRARPPPVNARIDETDSGSGWTGTLRGESKQLKPWEREALEMERYQGGTVDQPYRPHTQPPVAPKPKIVQISAQSTVRASGQPSSGGQGQRSVSPSVPPKPSRTSAARPEHQNHLSPVANHAPDNVSGGHRGPAGGSNVVHLQYNSPIGLYSKDNVRDTYVGQTQARAASHS